MLGEHLSTLERTKGASSLAHCSAAPSHSVCSLPSGRSCEPPEGVRVGGGRGGGSGSDRLASSRSVSLGELAPNHSQILSSFGTQDHKSVSFTDVNPSFFTEGYSHSGG